MPFYFTRLFNEKFSVYLTNEKKKFVNNKSNKQNVYVIEMEFIKIITPIGK